MKHNYCDAYSIITKKDIYQLLVSAILFVLSLWALIANDFHVLCIPVQWEQTTIDAINQIYANIAISCIAGIIVFLLVTFIPSIYKRCSFKYIIDNRITDLGVLLRNMIEFADLKHTFKNDLSNIEEIETSLLALDWGDKCKMPTHEEIPIKDIFYKDVQEFYHQIADLLSYRDYLNDKQIEVIESIKEIDLEQALSIYVNNEPTNIEYVQQYITNLYKSIVLNFKQIMIEKKDSGYMYFEKEKEIFYSEEDFREAHHD